MGLGVGLGLTMAMQNAIGIDCSPHLTYVCCRRKMLILESRGTAMQNGGE